VKLKPGHYWLSVVANAGDGEWFWENQTTGTIEGDVRAEGDGQVARSA